MTLAPGTRLGPYEILDPLGAGGMGEVYRARDTRLDREVAIKVLPGAVSEDAELKRRFEREARTISQLTHPHICTLYDVGHQEGIDYLVMELLDGESLADRLESGALPPDQVIRYGIEIAEGLEKAHRAGIVHRDLKPGNVMLTKSGVKLLDFGLAKMSVAPRIASEGSSLPTEGIPSRPLTEKGTVMGTFQYMAPEQLEGKEADARTDIFAFGCVLYEMATGRKAFTGKSRASMIGAILKDHPAPISSITPMTPPALDRLVQTCLAKEPDDRFQTAHDVKLQLQWIAEGGSQAGAPAVVVSRRKTREKIAWALAALVAAALLASLAVLRRLSRTAPLSPAVLSLAIPSTQRLVTIAGPAAVVSPDGSRVAYVAQSEGKSQIYVRELDKPQATLLEGAHGSAPFFSPDGRWIGFFANGARLEKVSVFGGASVALSDVTGARGASWGEDGTIVFAQGLTSPLARVPAGGGPAKPFTHFDAGRREVTHRWPEILPGGKAVLFTASANNNDFTHADIQAASLSTGQSKVLVENAYFGRYLATGYLTYVSGGTLFAVPFDARRLEIIGTAMPVIPDILADLTNGSAQFSSSKTGTAVYLTGKTLVSQVTVVLVDRKGAATPLVKQPGDYYAPQFSPDGKQLALQVANNTWIYDLARQTMTPLTFPPANCIYPVWAPDGKRIVCEQSNPAAGGITLSGIPSDGTGSLQPLTRQGARAQIPSSWSPDGETLLFFQFRAQGSIGCDLWTLPVRPGGKPGDPRPMLGQDSAAMFVYPALSPDGRWLAYTSTESGTAQIYVVPYPGPGGKRQISSAGGRLPRWSRTGQELFFERLGNPTSAILSVPYRVQGDSFQPGIPEVLFQGQDFEFRAPYPDFDVAPDGQHFAMLGPAGNRSSELPLPTVVMNWFGRVKTLVSAGQK